MGMGYSTRAEHGRQQLFRKAYPVARSAAISYIAGVPEPSSSGSGTCLSPQAYRTLPTASSPKRSMGKREDTNDKRATNRRRDASCLPITPRLVKKPRS
jgi:hypothetical protein